MADAVYATDPEAVQAIRVAMLAALVQGDVPTAHDLALELLAGGVPFESIVADVVAPVQGEVGRRWAQGDLTVADEHAATAVVEDLVTMLAGGLAEGDGPHVVVACPEGDDHALPARIVATVLGLAGLRTTFLGASLPARDLERFLAEQRPTALALSVSVPSALAAAARSVRAAHEAGVPVVMGGGALGADEERARRLGADGWAVDPATALTLVNTWAAGGVALAADGALDERASGLARRRVALAGATLHALLTEHAPTQGLDDQRVARLGDELPRLIEVLEAAQLLREDALLAEYAAWLDATLTAHGYPPGLVGHALGALADACGDELDEARAIVRRVFSAR